VSNDRGQGAPPKAPQGPTPAATPAVGRPLRGPQASVHPPGRSAQEARGSTPPRADETALLYRKIAELEADATEAEARAVKAEREQCAADEMLGQMLARVSDVEARLRLEQKRAADAEAGGAQATRLRASQGEAQERLQTLEAQSERLRVDLTLARREAATHRLAAEDALHLLAKSRDETAELRAHLDREQEDREALWARIAEQERVAAERDQAGARARELAAELETLRRAAATHERALEALRESHMKELADALSERSRRDRSAADAEIAAGRRELAAVEEALAGALREIEAGRAAVAEAQGLLAGEREWVAEMEEDNLRREEDFEKTRRAQSRAEGYARAAEVRRVELEDSLAEAARTIAVGRGEIEALRVEAAMHRMRIAEMERERELSAGLIEVKAVPAEIERLRRRVASAEARAGQMHSELSGAIDEVTLLLTELERRELDTARVRTASLASARSMLEHVTAATRPMARPATEAAIPARPMTLADSPLSAPFDLALLELVTDAPEPLVDAPADDDLIDVSADDEPAPPSLAKDDDDETTIVVARKVLSQPPAS
jgi:hypothetical protein